ncbi:uncharacterized protein LOC141686647 [Apium graveolens]|uniref:uncharacterized protein LOC141686647 n=1 Tax=Apium graveolens TaxID=4045 RepID=UPI003D794361
MTFVLGPIPFAMWAMVIVGILPTSTKPEKYCIIAIDYMTKWVETRPLSAITEEAAKKFFLEQIILRFGIPKICVSDNETQFIGNKFRRSSTRETPFRLAYGTEALVPVEVGLESYRTEVYNVQTNTFGLRANVDLLEEKREASHQRNMKYLLQAAQHYDSEIKKRLFSIGDLILRELAASMPTRQGKLQPIWEGPYKVIEVIRPGTYKQETLADEAIKNT